MATLQNPPPFLMNTAISANFRAKILFSPTKLRSFCASSVDLNKTHELFHGRNCKKGPIGDGFRVRVKVSDSQLKENWLDSLSCPFVEKGLLPLSPPSPQSGDGEEPAIVAGSGWVVGIDPDLSGALAILRDGDSGCSAQVFDTPRLQVLVGKRIRRRLDAKSTVQLLRSFGAPLGTTAYIEQSLPCPQDGKQDDSRKAASELFPSLSSLLKRKKDHGRAEALLIAAYGKGLRRQQEEYSM